MPADERDSEEEFRFPTVEEHEAMLAEIEGKRVAAKARAQALLAELQQLLAGDLVYVEDVIDMVPSDLCQAIEHRFRAQDFQGVSAIGASIHDASAEGLGLTRQGTEMVDFSDILARNILRLAPTILEASSGEDRIQQLSELTLWWLLLRGFVIQASKNDEVHVWVTMICPQEERLQRIIQALLTGQATMKANAHLRDLATRWRGSRFDSAVTTPDLVAKVEARAASEREDLDSLD